jgi:glycosyltransferase involved in cell wall biosynthesis
MTEVIIENPLPAQALDLVVGIPSYNEADNIAFVVNRAAAGIREHFPDAQAAIINADNFSEDGTREEFLGAESLGIHRVYLSTARGVVGKGNNFLNLFEYLSPFQPKVVVVVDADLQSISPDWIGSLGKPVTQSYDFVTPYYARNEYDGTITNHICYPLLYGLLGKDIRQPIGGDFAFSGRLMRQWLSQQWNASIRQYGVDIFMTMEAILGDFSIAQVVLGSKIHKPSAPKLGPMFTQVVDTLFKRLLAARERWAINGNNLSKPPLLNLNGTGLQEPQDLGIDYKALKRQALREFVSRRETIEDILVSNVSERVEAMFESRRFRLTRRLWVETVYSYLKAYAQSGSEEVSLEVVEALKPLYFARVVSFIRETLELDHAASEAEIVRQAESFWRHRKRVSWS